MKTEFEIKILDVGMDEASILLEKLGFTKQPTLEFKRYIYSLLTTAKKESWIRLRTDGNKTTLSIKEYSSDKIDGVRELEITVDNFEKTHELLQKLGYESTNYQENRRTVYLNTEYAAEISIDEWPLIPAYLEIEGANSKIVTGLLAKINTAGKPTTSAPTAEVYKRYGLDLDKYKILKF